MPIGIYARVSTKDQVVSYSSAICGPTARRADSRLSANILTRGSREGKSPALNLTGSWRTPGSANLTQSWCGALTHSLGPLDTCSWLLRNFGRSASSSSRTLSTGLIAGRKIVVLRSRKRTDAEALRRTSTESAFSSQLGFVGEPD
jgi:hypothetical protein